MTTVRIKRKTDGAERHDGDFSRCSPEDTSPLVQGDAGILFEARWLVEHLEVLEVRMTWGEVVRGCQRE